MTATSKFWVLLGPQQLQSWPAPTKANSVWATIRAWQFPRQDNFDTWSSYRPKHLKWCKKLVKRKIFLKNVFMVKSMVLAGCYNIISLSQSFFVISVAIGASAGFFLGCSILSFLEIIYFFTLRLFWFIHKRRFNLRNHSYYKNQAEQ
jgi:hypothetical protein